MAESGHLSAAALDRALRDLAAQLDYPPTPALSRSVRRRLEDRPARRARRFAIVSPAVAWQRLAAAALVLLIIATSLALALSPGARRAVADRLGLRGVRIVVVASPTAPAGTAPSLASSPAATPVATAVPAVTPTATPGSTLGLGVPLTLDQARAHLTYQVLVPGLPGLESPDAVYLDPAPPGGLLSLVYAPRPDLPALPNSDVGLVLNEFQGSLDPNLFMKMAAPEQIHVVTVNGATGYWIDGPHNLVYRDASGEVQFRDDRLAGNTLLWEQGGVTFRLESELSQAEALAIAASLP